MCSTSRPRALPARPRALSNCCHDRPPAPAAAAPQRHDLEQLLWKSAFYRPIEEFRRRIREHAAAGNEDLLGKVRDSHSVCALA